MAAATALIEHDPQFGPNRDIPAAHGAEYTDDALMARVGAGDAAAFSDLITRHAKTLYRIAYRMTGDAALGEDLAQEALLRLWRDAQYWRAGHGGIGGWLRRVTINLALDNLRKRRFVSTAEPPDRADEAALAPTTIDTERARAATVAAIAALSDRQRAAIVLTYYEDQPNRAAAEAMDMDIKAFESLLLRARRTLKTMLLPLVEHGK